MPTRRRASAPVRRTAREKRDPGATPRALLEAAAALFAEHGFEGVSVEDVADRAHVNKALVSYHFGGKRGLYVAVLESGFSRMADRLSAIEEGDHDARQTLHAFMEAFATTARERPDLPVLFLREAVSTGIEPAVVPHLVRILGVTRRLAERGAREGLFRRVDPLLFHFGLVSGLAFYVGTERARQKARARGHLPMAMPSTGAFLRYLEELTVRGLAPPPPDKTVRKGARR
jgi:TetR/AcrR family transcriptional regulator